MNISSFITISERVTQTLEIVKQPDGQQHHGDSKTIVNGGSKSTAISAVTYRWIVIARVVNEELYHEGVNI